MKSSGILRSVSNWLEENHQGRMRGFEPVGGGCINDTGVISLGDARSLFVKLNRAAPADFFAAEARGLAALADGCDLRVPAVIHIDRDFLLLEDLGRGRPRQDFWVRLGEGLAELHAPVHPAFGFDTDNYCGSTPQINIHEEDGYEFFARHRLLLLGQQARDERLLEERDAERLDSLASNLSRWIPRLPAVLIHGDLWSGNVHCDREGHPALIDPACYYGWAEAELAMTALFGGFPDSFYQAYESASSCAPDWRERAGLYNLYHLLNHLVLFGSGYLGQVRQVLERYA